MVVWLFLEPWKCRGWDFMAELWFCKVWWRWVFLGIRDDCSLSYWLVYFVYPSLLESIVEKLPYFSSHQAFGNYTFEITTPAFSRLKMIEFVRSIWRLLCQGFVNRVLFFYISLLVVQNLLVEVCYLIYASGLNSILHSTSPEIFISIRI